jgi:hypothetical protein
LLRGITIPGCEKRTAYPSNRAYPPSRTVKSALPRSPSGSRHSGAATSPNGLGRANHFGGGRGPLKHRPDRLSPFNRFLHYLMIDRVVVVEGSHVRSITALKRSTQVFTTCFGVFGTRVELATKPRQTQAIRHLAAIAWILSVRARARVAASARYLKAQSVPDSTSAYPPHGSQGRKCLVGLWWVNVHH